MSIPTLKQATFLTSALFCMACNPFAVDMDEPKNSPRQRPAASSDLPASEAGSAQVSLGDSLSTDWDHGNRSRHRN